MSRRRRLVAALACLVLTVPLGGCPLANMACLPGELSAGKFTSVRTNLDPAKGTVATGETITLWVETNLDSGGLQYAWSASSGMLSTSCGPQVQWTAGTAGRAIVTVRISSASDSTSAQYAFTVR